MITYQVVSHKNDDVRWSFELGEALWDDIKNQNEDNDFEGTAVGQHGDTKSFVPLNVRNVS